MSLDEFMEIVETYGKSRELKAEARFLLEDLIWENTWQDEGERTLKFIRKVLVESGIEKFTHKVER